ncbi:hypothetical protein C8A05DRAFT_44879 [Staphylotrichum tortipilum]|uniref:Uncharacterized protein n=1 Tax=Staphylotrichum tortipilum TaxID=2831512 RepID=A0AAN6MJ05_9PEZI|nr:hypothetical protein C8A05DRAFT_44879 [Staphylotrichum longicolle]
MAVTTTHSTISPAPYQEGVELRIQKHVPPKPFSRGHGPCPRSNVGLNQDVEFVDRVDFALNNPPLATEPPAQDEHIFTITASKTLRRFHANGSGAHVIYDGVHYPLYVGDNEIDCMTLADADYATEAWAYETMQPVEGVRMILLELIHGETILDKIRKTTVDDVVQQDLLPDQETRLRILKDILDAERSIWWDAEVLHEDLTPRNVMVVVYRFFYEPHCKHDENADPLPDSPIECYWPFPPGSGTLTSPGSPWASWVPPSWLKDPEQAAEWVLETWASPVSGKYAPLTDYFLNHPDHARRSKKLQAALEKLGRRPAKDYSSGLSHRPINPPPTLA